VNRGKNMQNDTLIELTPIELDILSMMSDEDVNPIPQGNIDRFFEEDYSRKRIKMALDYLDRHGLVKRRSVLDYSIYTPKIHYSLTDLGREYAE
jgi:DNA-binding PadR family transcriptional regulator